ncbi:MAG: D-alanyl-D-alanine carboxypeptidase [Nocardiopsaceae bacterium]|nr:D-alanyl-D-alanine carboxypeptidase [Nocardiopsaceae bacterium]
MRLCSGLMAKGMAAGLVVTGLAGFTQVSGATTARAATVARSVPATGLRSATGSGPTGIKATYAEVASAQTGASFWSRSPDTEVPMGSITKVMTAYVVLKAGHLNRLITVPGGITAYDKKYGASTAGLKPGERLTARQLLYAMLVPSGCDAAYTLATAYGPGRGRFIARMNAAAARLGLSSTHFTDFSGLPDPTERSTYSDARDLIALGRDAMALPLFASIVRTAKYHLPHAWGEHPAFTWKTSNPLIGSYDGAVGIKTGDTRVAGDCLLFEAVRDGDAVIGVVLHDRSWKAVTSDSEALLDYGFSQS